MAVNRDLFYRLRWEVFGSSSDIVVDHGANSGGLELVPFETDPCAEEYPIIPPSTRMEIRSFDLVEKACHDENFEEDRYQPPSSLIIEHTDGTSIKAREFVVKTHEYLNQHRNAIIDYLDETYAEGDQDWEDDDVLPTTIPDSNLPSGAQVFFDFVSGPSPGDQFPTYGVKVAVTGSYGCETAEKFWLRRRELMIGREKDRIQFKELEMWRELEVWHEQQKMDQNEDWEKDLEEQGSVREAITSLKHVQL